MKCPYCSSENIARILYGMPAMDNDLKKEIEEGRVYIGGCCVTDNDPEFHCNKCGQDFSQDDFKNRNGNILKGIIFEKILCERRSYFEEKNAVIAHGIRERAQYLTDILMRANLFDEYEEYEERMGVKPGEYDNSIG